MKTKPYPKGRWDNLIYALLISLHFSVILCRPASHATGAKSLTNFNSSISSAKERTSAIHHRHPHHPASNSIHSTQDLKTDSMAKFGEKDSKSANSIIPSHLNDISLSRDNSAGNDLRKVPFGNADSFRINGHHYGPAGGRRLIQGTNVFLNRDQRRDVIGGFEEVREYTVRLQTSPVMDKNEVASLIDESTPNRNLSRKRRQPPDAQKESHRLRRKRRRRHRLLLRTRNYLNPGNSSGGRDRFLLKADGPGQVIFGADEVKKDWCRTIPFNQTVTSGRCKPKVVKNNLCYGQCNSFFIPQSERTSNKVAFQSCANCKPQRLRWVNVTLSCPGQNPPKVQTTIMKVESCRCIAAERDEASQTIRYQRKKSKSKHAVQ